MASEIIVCGKKRDIDYDNVVTFESGGFDAHLPHHAKKGPDVPYPTHPAPGRAKRAERFRRRRGIGDNGTLGELREVVHQVVVHLDGCWDPAMCFDVLHNQRGLSVHFMVGNDGRIYQTLDVRDCALHAGGVNGVSVGIELSNRGDASRPAQKRKYPRGTRTTRTCVVHGQQFLAYDFTEPQYDAMVALCRALGDLLEIPFVSPVDKKTGALLWTTLAEPSKFSGFLGHYHVSRNKWDPGPFDFPRLFRAMAPRLTFPFTPPPGTRVSAHATAASKWIEEKAKAYYDSAEQGDAYFPVGPLGRSRLWHGGVHLSAEEGDPVYAPLNGKLVVARMGPPCAVGSCNFVLLSHAVATHDGWVRFYSLYFHLMREGSQWGIAPAAWHKLSASARNAFRGGRSALLDHPVRAGDVIGHVGRAGPPGKQSAQIHFAIFAERDIVNEIDPTDAEWTIVEGSRASRFCEADAVIGLIDKPSGQPRDGMLSRLELRNFFRFNRVGRKKLRHYAVRYPAEWTATPDWQTQLMRAPDFKGLPQPERERLVRQQIDRTLWWTGDVAKHAHLPRDGYVYAYHPITFLQWFDKVMRDKRLVRSNAIGDAKAWQGVRPPARYTVDLDRTAAVDMIDHEDRLTLEDLVRGYDADPNAKRP